MSSEALLENPAMFNHIQITPEQLALEYIHLSTLHNPTHKYIKSHLYKILYQGFQDYTDLRDQFGASNLKDNEDQIAVETIVKTLMHRRAHKSVQERWGWYTRYRKGELQLLENTQKNEEADPNKKICLENNK